MKVDSLSIYDTLNCSVCLDIFEKPIRQCIKGHSFCTKCIDPQNIKLCPECRSQISETRNYKLEELIESIALPCENKDAGCTYKLKKPELQEHHLECQHRKLKCEGKKFCNWNCNWEGNKLLAHFKEQHPASSSLEYNATVTIRYNDKSDFSDLQLISAHYHLFWYKHKVDVKKGLAYWAFQMIGLRKQTLNYYYEFEFFMAPPSVRKYKVTEVCTSDLDDINEIFDSEKCVAISLKTLKNYVDANNEYTFRFRLMKIKKPETPEIKPTLNSPPFNFHNKKNFSPGILGIAPRGRPNYHYQKK